MSTDEHYDLLIITPKEFLPALQPLIEHKNYTDMKTCELSLEKIEQLYQGSDLPEKVKRALADYNESFKIKYAMLVGDIDKFPVRHIMGINTEWDTRFYPSDLYYADLYDDDGNFDNWDYDDDNRFGETNFLGGTDSDKVNIDKINLKPDIAVGRIPASTAQEVTNYVNKVIKYEFNAWRSSWVKKALVISDHDTSGAFSDKVHKDNIENFLSAYFLNKIYLKDPPYNNMNIDQRAAKINGILDTGIGFVAHMGHGEPTAWSSFYRLNDIAKLQGKEKLPIVSTIACLTAVFHYSPEIYGYEKYWTTDGKEWKGTGVQKADRPMPDSIQSSDYDFDSMVEQFLVKSETGAIGYIGSVAKGEHGGKALQKYFVEQLSFSSSWSTLGTLWKYAMTKFTENEAQPGMGYYYGYIHQHKVMLFGDPSLRIMGVTSFQKKDFEGTYDMFHDSWRGTLILKAADGDFIENMPNIIGTYTEINGKEHKVYGYVRAWNYPFNISWGPDHQIIFYIDFHDTPTKSDDTRFQGYLFTHGKEAIAGITWWNNIPFGFYAIKRK